MSDVDEEYVCFRYADPDDGTELKILPKTIAYAEEGQDGEGGGISAEVTKPSDPGEKRMTETDDILRKKPFYKRRHFNQLFIKGDNVVYVCEALRGSTPDFYLQCKNKYPDLH